MGKVGKEISLSGDMGTVLWSNIYTVEASLGKWAGISHPECRAHFMHQLSVSCNDGAQDVLYSTCIVKH